MTLMDAYRLTLRERTHWAKASALENPTRANLTAYGLAIMAYREQAPATIVRPITVTPS